MTLQTAMLATLTIVFGVAQYALCLQALRDLARRPRVRGDNKALWGLGILCLPIAGAILYNWMGPTSFINRRAPATDSTSRDCRREPAVLHPSPANVTPISAAHSVRQRRAGGPGNSGNSGNSGNGGGDDVLPSAPGRARAGRTGS